MVRLAAPLPALASKTSYTLNGWAWEKKNHLLKNKQSNNLRHQGRLGMSEPDNLQLIQAFLDTQSTMALATISTNGQPQVAPIFYVADERLNFYWLSSPNSRHSTNLVLNPKVAATVYPSVWQWNDIVGLQIEGEARPIGDERIREQILTIYL